MVTGGIYLDAGYGIIKIRKVCPNGSVAIVDELNEDLSHKLRNKDKLDGEGNWITRAITRERGISLTPYTFFTDGEPIVQQEELF